MYKEADWLTRLQVIAKPQFQSVSRTQALTVLSKDQLTRLLAAGFLRRLHAGVYALPGASASWRQRAMAACLSLGPPVATFGFSAAHLWELDDGRYPQPLEVVVPHNRSGRCPGVVVHRRQLPTTDLASRFEIPVTSPARTILDLSTRLPPSRLGRWLDEALRRHQLTIAELEQRLEMEESRSQRRSLVVRALLDDRAGGYRAGDSPAEDEIYFWIVSAGLPPPARQVQVEIDGQLFLLDLAYILERIAVEYDSVRYHGGAESFHADRDRMGELQLAGWLVLPVTARRDRTMVVDWVGRALATRRAGMLER